MMNNAVENFDILAISLNVLHNYFYSLLKLFSDLYLVTFLDISTNCSAKLFFLVLFEEALRNEIDSLNL